MNADRFNPSSNGQLRHDPPEPSSERDARLYVPRPEGWEARVKTSSEKCYCYVQNPGEDYFHLIVYGEIFLQRGYETICLNCARRQGFISEDRLHWQHGSSMNDFPGLI